MLVTLNDIERRHARRKSISETASKLVRPLINDPESIKEHNKRNQELCVEYAQATWLIEQDMEALLAVVRKVLPVDKREEQFKEIVEPLPINKFVALRLAEQEDRQRKQREEIDGQLHVGDTVTKEGKVKKGAIAKTIDPDLDAKQEAKEQLAK